MGLRALDGHFHQRHDDIIFLRSPKRTFGCVEYKSGFRWFLRCSEYCCRGQLCSVQCSIKCQNIFKLHCFFIGSLQKQRILLDFLHAYQSSSKNGPKTKLFYWKMKRFSRHWFFVIEIHGFEERLKRLVRSKDWEQVPFMSPWFINVNFTQTTVALLLLKDTSRKPLSINGHSKTFHCKWLHFFYYLFLLFRLPSDFWSCSEVFYA